MKKLITLLLCLGIFILAIWSYNMNINNNEITSSKQTVIKNNLISEYLKERNEIRKQIEISNIKKEKKTETREISKKEPIPLYDIPLSVDLQEYIYKTCKEKGIPYEMTLAIIKTESNFNPKARNVNTNGSVDKGLMQINSIHSKWCKELGITNLFDPYQNIKIGTTMLSNLYSKYKDVNHVLIAYNMGERNLRKNLKVGRGTTNYSRKVVSNINIILNSK